MRALAALALAGLLLTSCIIPFSESDPPTADVFFRNDTQQPIALLVTGTDQDIDGAFRLNPERILNLQTPGEQWLVGNTNLFWTDETESAFCFRNQRLWFVTPRAELASGEAVTSRDVRVVQRLDEPCFEHRSVFPIVGDS